MVLHGGHVVSVEDDHAQRDHNVDAEPGEDLQFARRPAQLLHACPPNEGKQEDHAERSEELQQDQVKHRQERILEGHGPIIQNAGDDAGEQAEQHEDDSAGRSDVVVSQDGPSQFGQDGQLEEGVAGEADQSRGQVGIGKTQGDGHAHVAEQAPDEKDAKDGQRAVDALVEEHREEKQLQGCAGQPEREVNAVNGHYRPPVRRCWESGDAGLPGSLAINRGDCRTCRLMNH